MAHSGRSAEAATAVTERRAAVLRAMSSREAPRIMLLFVVIIIVFDAAYVAIGMSPPIGYYISDVIQASVYTAVAVLILRKAVPQAWVPGLVAMALVVSNGALNYQFTIAGYGTMGIIVMLMAVMGPITLMWRPFLIAGFIMVTVTSTNLLIADSEEGAGWAITVLTALGASAVLLYGRRASALDLAEATISVERLATHDPLTQVLNRHGLDEATPILAGLAERGPGLYAAFVDVDALKPTNDVHGHTVGDLVITRVAQAIVQASRHADVVCRWGGDEFVVVGLAPAPPAEELRDRILQSLDVQGLDGKWNPSVTVGVASSSAGDVSAVIAAADDAMYASRHRAVTTRETDAHGY